MSALPRVILWAWERPEDLRFINPQQVGVAYLAATVSVRGSDFRVSPRLQPLRLPGNTRLIAVVRIETRPPHSNSRNHDYGTPSVDSADKIAEQIARLTQIPGVAAVQIDFDARTTERAFYSLLLQRLRERLPNSFPLSITALASWCIGDTWISALPVDQAVPMLFRMGPGGADVRRYLSAGRDFRISVCRDSAGIATDESLPVLPPGRQIFIFSPQPWTGTAAAQILEQLRR
jgi:hypothetical protein